MGGSLSAAEEKERQCLLGQLIDQDPVFVLTREIAEAQALELGSDTSEERHDRKTNCAMADCHAV